MSGTIRRQILSSVLVAAAVIAAVAVGFGLGRTQRGSAHSSNPHVTPIRPAPQYVLTDQLGNAVNSTAFDGKVQIVTFLFPYCTEYCPLIAADLVRLERDIKGTPLAKQIRIVAFNVDPSGSGPPQMRSFLNEYGWNPRDTRLEFLTGPAATIRRVVTQGYMVDYQRVSFAQEARQVARDRAAGIYVPQPVVENKLAATAHVDYDVAHNDILEVVGPDQRIYKIFDDAEKVPEASLIALSRALLGAD